MHRLLCLRLLVPALLLAACAAASAEITITNIRDGETIRYPVALLRGAAGAGPVSAANQDNPRPGGEFEAPVANGRYVALLELVPGRNRLSLAAGSETAKLTLTYRPMRTPYKMNVVWVTANDKDEHYEAPRADDPQDYRARLDTAAKLMQTFTAEALNDRGFGRKTFNLEFDKEGKVVIHTVAYPAPAAELQAKDGGQLYDLLYGWVDKQFPTNRNKNMVLMAFTRYDRQARQAKAHTALGGGGMGLFGSGDVWCWPASLQDVPRVFGDATPIDPATALDDSAYRSCIWGLASTTIGAVMHEMGHTFGLPHIDDPHCIMSRGFDLFNRYFTPIEPPRAGRKEPTLFKETEVARWNEYYAAQLAAHRWMQPDAQAFRDEPGPGITLDAARDEFVFGAPHGLAFYGVQTGDPVKLTTFYKAPAGLEKVARVSRASVWGKVGEKGKLRLLAVDRQGNEISLDEAAVRNPDDFLTEWRLLRAPQPWANPPASPVLGDAEREVIEKALRKERPRRFRNTGRSSFCSCDLGQVYGDKENVVAYALATVRSDREKPVKLLAGGDDGYRVWVNGTLVMDRPGMKNEPPDTHQVPITLAAGENTVLVECTQGGGGWGFSVRLAE